MITPANRKKERISGTQHKVVQSYLVFYREASVQLGLGIDAVLNWESIKGQLWEQALAN